MSSSVTVVLRRTWPQRLVILLSLAVVAAALVVAWFLDDVYASLRQINRVHISGEVLLTDTAPGEPVNFLLIGEDSALGLAADDPVTFGRETDPRGRFQADSITIVRVDPTTGQAWVLSLPRDLLVDVRGRQQKINATLLIEGPELLVETVSSNFDIPINHYMTLDFLGFRQVVNELDGVPVWFGNPARDFDPVKLVGSGLDISVAGCNVLDGEQALQYVRARSYQELIDGEWVTIGNSDFGRIERQQDFLVLALDRAISRGARQPTTLAALIEAGANSIVLDDQLTVAELIDVGEAFSDFSPDTLQRRSVQVETIYEGDVYIGERLLPEANEGVFDIFRGSAGLPAAEDVSFDLFMESEEEVAQAAEELGALGFVVSSTFTMGSPSSSVIVYPSGELGAAEAIARQLEPIPPIVENPAAGSVSVVLGADHRQILFIIPHEIAKTRAAIAAYGDVDLPDLSDVESGATAPTTTSTSASTTTSAASVDEAATTTTSQGIIGQAPEGQSCG